MVPLIVTVLVLVLVAFPLWALIRIISLGREKDRLGWRLDQIDRQLNELREQIRTGPTPAAGASGAETQPSPLSAAQTTSPHRAAAAVTRPVVSPDVILSPVPAPPVVQSAEAPLSPSTLAGAAATAVTPPTVRPSTTPPRINEPPLSTPPR